MLHGEGAIKVMERRRGSSKGAGMESRDCVGGIERERDAEE